MLDPILSTLKGLIYSVFPITLSGRLYYSHFQKRKQAEGDFSWCTWWWPNVSPLILSYLDLYNVRLLGHPAFYMLFPDGSLVDMYPELVLSFTTNYMRLEVDPSLMQPPDEISTLADTFDCTLRRHEAKDPSKLCTDSWLLSECTSINI